MSGSLREVSEQGKGQEVNQSYVFADGRKVTLEGIVLDGNQLAVFCRMTCPRGEAKDIDIHPLPYARGFLSDANLKRGTGVVSEDHAEFRYVFSFEPPAPWVKTLRLTFVNRDGQIEEAGDIVFLIHRRKAMGYTFRQEIQKSWVIDGVTVTVERIEASPTLTVLKGSLRGSLGVVYDTLAGERFYPRTLDLSLYANGEKLNPLGGGIKTDIQGITFRKEYEALPKDLTSLKAKIHSLVIDKQVGESFSLGPDWIAKPVEIKGTRLSFDSIETKGEKTYLTLMTREEVHLRGVSLLREGKRIPLKETVDEEMMKREDGLYTIRTLVFEGVGEKASLYIQSMLTKKDFSKTLFIPLE